jgi:Xaa-Pro aminopeptidase
MVVRPSTNSKTGEIEALTSFLAPSFEVERARLLGMPFEGSLDFIPWEEHWNPYEILRRSWNPKFAIGGDLTTQEVAAKVMVDEEMRDFIQRGLSENDFDVVGLGGEVERVKQTKTQREIEIVRAVNTGTVVALRAMRECMYPGLTENEVMNVLDNMLRVAGMEPFFDIVLFGKLGFWMVFLPGRAKKSADENASNPHGGTNGSKVLEAETFVLIDVGYGIFSSLRDCSLISNTVLTSMATPPTSAGHFSHLSSPSPPLIWKSRHSHR